MTIPEAAALVMQSASLLDETTEVGEVFLLDMGEPIRIVDLAERYVRLHGLTPVPHHNGSRSKTYRVGEIGITFTGARPGEKLHEQLAFDQEAMRPTRHPDINIWMLPPPDDRYIARLAALDIDRRPSDPAELARTIRGLVPEMVPPVAVA